VDTLGVHSPEHPTLTPVPSAEFIYASIEREAVRRIFWLIHLMDVMAAIYFKKPITFTDSELRLRLPVDETSFELGVHSTLPGEFLHQFSVRLEISQLSTFPLPSAGLPIKLLSPLMKGSHANSLLYMPPDFHP
jgi:hypothetical protein